MAFSQQFRALLKLAGIWAVPWTLLGVALAIVRWVASPDISSTGNSLGGLILNHGMGYGALG